MESLRRLAKSPVSVLWVLGFALAGCTTLLGLRLPGTPASARLLEAISGSCQAESGLLIPVLVKLYDLNGDNQQDSMEIWQAGKKVAVISLGTDGSLSHAEVLEGNRIRRYDNPEQFIALYPDVCAVAVGGKTGA